MGLVSKLGAAIGAIAVLFTGFIGMVVLTCNTVSRTAVKPVNPARSVGAIFFDGTFGCSGSEIALPNGGKAFLTARHCLVDDGFNLRTKNFMVSFSDDEKGPFYLAKPLALGLDDDVALLALTGDADVPTVQLADEHTLKAGDPIYNISFPLSAGKLRFDGEFQAARYPHMPAGLEMYPEWRFAMPMNLTIAHGSSGSPVFNTAGDVIGVAVGATSEGQFNIAIPATRVYLIAEVPAAFSWETFTKAHPPQPEDIFEIIFN